MSHTLSEKPLHDVIRNEFDEHFLWLTESKKGGHAPEVSTAKFIIRRYLNAKKPDISSAQIEKYFTPHNIAAVMKLLEKFYKEKGVFSSRPKPSRSRSPKRKISRKSPKKKTTSRKRKPSKESRRTTTARKPAKESRRKSPKRAKKTTRKSKESRNISRIRAILASK